MFKTGTQQNFLGTTTFGRHKNLGEDSSRIPSVTTSLSKGSMWFTCGNVESYCFTV